MLLAPSLVAPFCNLTNIYFTRSTQTHTGALATSGAVSEELVAGDPDVGRRRGLDVDERGALAGGQRREPAREHVAVPHLLEPPDLAVELGVADVGARGPSCLTCWSPSPSTGGTSCPCASTTLDLDGRRVFS